MSGPIQQSGSDDQPSGGPFVTNPGPFGRRRRQESGPEPDENFTEDQVDELLERASRRERFDIARIVMVAVIVCVVSVAKHATTWSHIQPVSPAPSAPATSPLPRSQGRFDVTVTSISGTAVDVAAAGQTLHWRAERQDVRDALARSIGDEVLVYWRSDSGVTTIVGVKGPHASVQPDAPAPLSA